MKNKPLLFKKYSISSKLYENAFIVFQKKYVYPRNFVISAVFAAILVYNLVCFIKDTSSAGIIFVLICAACIASIWTSVIRIRKNLMKAINQSVVNDIYTFELYDDKITIKALPNEDNNVHIEAVPEDEDFFADEKEDDEEIQTSEICFDNSTLRVIEKEEFFMLYLIKSVFYVVPKEVFKEDEVKALSEMFSSKLGKKYIK